ncbi:MAG: hypothetical protein KME29_05570 [Calothrix sp. FI2-JRJ7]|jgi:acyl carrier protein|nr:hypothetical protein [Calothrix sp. FI2-JRJ7]
MNRAIATNGAANGIYSNNGDKSKMQKFDEPTYDVIKPTNIMSQIQTQNVLSAVHQQFHYNQGKYIDLLTKVVESQAVMVEKYQNSSTLPKIMQNIEQILHILHNNQSHYNTNHEGYLQNQLALIQGEEFLTNASNTLNDSSLNQVPNYPVFQTEPFKTEAEAPILPASNKSSNAHMEVAPNYPIDEVEIAPSFSNQQEVHKSVDTSTSQSSTSQSTNGKTPSELTSTSPQILPTLKGVTITQENIPTSSTPISTPSSAPVSTSPQSPILETKSYPVEDNSTSVESTPPAPVVDTSATNSIDATKFGTRLLEVISDKTGYPIDMLDMDMDLEADLGIDSIKQVQIFAAMQEEFPEVDLDAEAIAELRTLTKIVDYVKKNVATDEPTSAIERQVVKKNS